MTLKRYPKKSGSLTTQSSFNARKIASQDPSVNHLERSKRLTTSRRHALQNVLTSKSSLTTLLMSLILPTKLQRTRESLKSSLCTWTEG